MVKSQNSSAVNTSKSQRINQAKYGDITVRYGKDKRSNFNKKVPIVKKNMLKPKAEKKLANTHRRARVSHESDEHRITLSRFLRWSLMVTIIVATLWAVNTEPTINRERRSIKNIMFDFAQQYIPMGYTGGQSGAAWSRQRRSTGAHSDDMSNPHNGAENDETIIQKVMSDFAKIVKSESEGYNAQGSFNKNFENDGKEDL